MYISIPKSFFCLFILNNIYIFQYQNQIKLKSLWLQAELCVYIHTHTLTVTANSSHCLRLYARLFMSITP